jgi:ankyrin repeat protein
MGLADKTKKIFARRFDPVTLKAALVVDDAKKVSETVARFPEALNWTDAKGRSALNLAIHLRSDKTAAYLVWKGADIEHTDPELNMTPLCAAIFVGALGTAQKLIEKGARFDRRDGYDSTPLLRATSDESLDLMKLLIRIGANVNALCSDFTPLMLAAMGDHPKAAALLIASGADIGTRKQNGVTADQLSRSSRMTAVLEPAKRAWDKAKEPEIRAQRAAAARQAELEAAAQYLRERIGELDTMRQDAHSGGKRHLRAPETFRLNRHGPQHR